MADGADADTTIEMAAAKAPFSWPEDPSHPVLQITVEAPEARGVILVELMPELAPATVVSVIELADEGFYDGTTFHRVIPGFMIQGGDPNSRDRDPSNDGNGPSGRPLHDEFGDAPFVRGVVGMGNRGREDSSSTQFFIMHADNTNLDGRYTAVGRVLAGMPIVDAITLGAIDRSGRWGPKDRPIENVVMASVRTIGQLADVQATLDSEPPGPAVEPPSEDQLAASGKPTASISQSPASRATSSDWQELEASGR
jgi:cyclophilin family peptidyl-prolyl cis-trans isomerase